MVKTESNNRIHALSLPYFIALLFSAASEEVLEQHTVSGFSSGANLAIIHSVIHSSNTTGIGIIGGSPYGCNVINNSDYICSYWSNNASNGDGVNASMSKTYDDICEQYLLKRSKEQRIDSLENLKETYVYLYSGIRDSVVYQPGLFISFCSNKL